MRRGASRPEPTGANPARIRIAVTSVGIAGDGPAVEAIVGALEDTAATATRIDPAGVAGTDVGVVVGSVADGYDDAVENARDSGTPLLVVELGGVGGVPVADVEAAVSGSAPGTACHDCLRARVEAADPETGGEPSSAGADGQSGGPEASVARFAGAVAGRELAELVAGGRSSVVGGVVEVPYTERRVLPVPYCDCAAAGDGGSALARDGLPTDHDERPLEAAIGAAEVAFDARVGPITNVGEAESYPVPYYLSTLAAAPFSDGEVPDHAAGVAADWDPAFMKALGESLERYSGAVYREADFTTDPASPIDLASVVQPGEPPSVDEIGAWHPAEHLETGAAVDLPAELVVFPPPERTIRPPITTGLGLGNGGVNALLSGLYEVVERDAAMLSWYSTYDPLGLAVDDEGFETLAARARSEALETTALLLTQDVDVPVIAACVHREDEWPRFAVGMSAALDPEVAARGALEEAIQNWQELRRMGPDDAAEQSGAIGEYAAFPDAARSFVDPETTVPASSVGPAEQPAGHAELEAVVDRVTAAGLDPYAASLTPRDVDDLGFEAVRVVVPGAQPLFTGETFFGERARTVPAELGFESRLDRRFHPFP